MQFQGGITIPIHKSIIGISLITGVFNRQKSTKKLTKKYMELYYPTSGKMTYFIKFDWGEYIITTEEKKGTEVHEDSKPYLGYITFRPEITGQPSKEQPGYYVITPEGIVWENLTGQGISKTSERQEITRKKAEHGTSTQIITIQSVSEPLIDHFKAYPEQWRRYGKLDIQGNKTRLIIEDRNN